MIKAAIKTSKGLSLILSIFTLWSFPAGAQTDSPFEPHGKPFVLIFSDLSYTSNKEGSLKAFELTRAFLGYEYYFSSKISSKINIDLADPGVGELKMTAVIRNAFVQYKDSKFSARFGMIDVDQFTIQQAQWGYRYIYKSFQDAYKFTPPSDLGVAIEYSPVKFISFDLSVLNGEGFKKVEVDSIFKTTFGITLRPFDGFVIRGYSDMMKKDYTQTSLALMAGYSVKKFRAGLEYNLQTNKDMIDGNDLSGISVYASQGLAEKFSIFARYDYLNATSPDDVQETGGFAGKEGQLFIAGFDFTPIKGIRIAPTYLGYAPDDKSQPFTSRFGLYFEIRY